MPAEILIVQLEKSELITLIKDAVSAALSSSKNPKRLTITEASRELGVTWKTCQKMLKVTGREYVYEDEIDRFKTEYYEKRKLQRTW